MKLQLHDVLRLKYQIGTSFHEYGLPIKWSLFICPPQNNENDETQNRLDYPWQIEQHKLSSYKHLAHGKHFLDARFYY